VGAGGSADGVGSLDGVALTSGVPQLLHTKASAALPVPQLGQFIRSAPPVSVAPPRHAHRRQVAFDGSP
jgi:hypothetical protein